MSPDVIIFDLDDTLLYQESVNRDIIQELFTPLVKDPQRLRTDFLQKARTLWSLQESFPLCRNLGISSGEGLWGEFLNPGEAMLRLRTEALAFRLQVWKDTLEENGLDESLAPILRDDFIQHRRATQEWLPGTGEILEALYENYSLSLLTNGASDLQWFKIRASGLEKYFDQIVVSGDVGVGKPDPEIFRHLTSAHPIDTRFLMVGNSLSSDIRGASNAGIPAVWLDREGELLPADLKPWKIIRELMELKELL